MPGVDIQDDYETDSSDNEENHSKLLSSVSQLDSTQRIKPAQRKEIASEVSEYNLSKGLPTGEKLIKVNELVQVLAKKPEHGALSTKIQKVTKKSKVLQKPLEKPIEERLKRAVGFVKVKEELRKWDAIVTRNAIKDRISFPLNSNSVKLEKSNDFLSKFKSPTPLEAELAKVLHQKPKEEKDSDDEEFPLTYDEMMKKRKEMAQLRARLSYNQAKAQRQSRIKSKKYHRLMKREKLKQQLKEFELLQKTDPEAALKKLAELDKTRAQERVSLRHRNTGKWAKNLSVRAKYDVETRKVLAEQLKMSRELTQKVSQFDNSDNEEVIEQIPSQEAVSNETAKPATDNPWMINVSKEVEDFVSDCKKFWSEKGNKINQNESKEKEKQPNIVNEMVNGSSKASKEILIDSKEIQETQKLNISKDKKVQEKQKLDISKVNKEGEETHKPISIENKEILETHKPISIENKEIQETHKQNNSKGNKVKKKQKLGISKGSNEVKEIQQPNIFKGSKKVKEKQKLSISKGNKEVQKTEKLKPPTEVKSPKKKESNRKETKKSPKDGKTRMSVHSTSGVWTVTPVKEEPVKINNKRKAENIDALFDELNDKLLKKAKKKVDKIQKNLKKEEKRKKKLKEKKSETEFDLSLKSRTVIERPDMDNGLLEGGVENDIMEGVSETIPVVDKTKDEAVPSIDPKAFIQINPKRLNSQLPDNITGEENHLDDDEKAQQKIIEEAFEEDDVMAEFNEMKKQEEENRKVNIQTSLPGWGEWVGTGIEPRKRKKRLLVLKVPRRKDKHKPDTIINENENPNLKQHLVKEVPHPFKSVDAFEANIRAPVGRDWVPETAHQKLIQKQIVTKLGTVIEPMSEEEIVKLKKTPKSPYQGKQKKTSKT